MILLSAQPIPAANLFVSPNGNHVPPFTRWRNAATNIQSAIDAASPGDTVWVGRGVYDTGGRAGPGGLTNRVVLDKVIDVRSFSGPDVTFIVGQPASGGGNGPDAVRCVYATTGGSLSGFTFMDGHTLTTYVQQCSTDTNYPPYCWIVDESMASGGGVWCDTQAVVITDCTFQDNSAHLNGGGLANGTAVSCTFSGNDAQTRDGGGAYACVVSNCIFDGNAAGLNGGGAAFSEIADSEFRENQAAGGGGGVNSCHARSSVFAENEAASAGGGAIGGTFVNCLFVRNSAPFGGAGTYCSLENCTVVGNTAGEAGGLGVASAVNCILVSNTAPVAPNWYDVYAPIHSCTFPSGGRGSITNDPAFVNYAGGNFRLTSNSPCINQGTNGYWVMGATDLDGKQRVAGGMVDMGAYEFWPLGVTGVISVTASADVTQTVIGVEVVLTADLQGPVLNCRWEFGDGAQATGPFQVPHAYAVPGDYEPKVVAWNLDHSVTSSVPVHILDTDVHVAPSGDDANSGATWTNAKATIQAGIDDAWAGAKRVLVSNGTYNVGGRAGPGGLTNRVLLDKPLVLESVNGPESTFIVGHPASNGGCGADAIRCLYASTGTLIAGFTFRDGHTTTQAVIQCGWRQGSWGCWETDESPLSGGGVWCHGTRVTVSNCAFFNNAARRYGGAIVGDLIVGCLIVSNTVPAGEGGGAYWGYIMDSEFIANSAINGGGAFRSTLKHCILRGNSAYQGGGTEFCNVSDSVFIENHADGNGGGSDRVMPGGVISGCTFTSNSAPLGGAVANAAVDHCELSFNSATSGGAGSETAFRNCLIHDNTADYGGAAESSRLDNCTVVRNFAAVAEGATYVCSGNNDIIVSNSAPYAPNMDWNFGGMAYICSWPDLGDGTWITNDPVFADYAGGDFRLASNSPCINRGTNADWMIGATDLDGNPRIQNAVVDMGAYESPYWGMFSDVDGDRITDHDEACVAGTEPTNAASCLQVDSSSAVTDSGGVVISWASRQGRLYNVYRTTNLLDGDVVLVFPDVPGLDGFTVVTDATAVAEGQGFYRVGVKAPAP